MQPDCPPPDPQARLARLDWPGLFRLGVRDLRMSPVHFWDLTPAELCLLLGLEAAPETMTRARLEALSRAYPDTPPTAGDNHE